MSKLGYVSIVKSSFLQISWNGNLFFSTWRAASTLSLYKEGSQLSGVHADIFSPEINAIGFDLVFQFRFNKSTWQ